MYDNLSLQCEVMYYSKAWDSHTSFSVNRHLRLSKSVCFIAGIHPSSGLYEITEKRSDMKAIREIDEKYQIAI